MDSPCNWRKWFLALAWKHNTSTWPWDAHDAAPGNGGCVRSRVCAPAPGHVQPWTHATMGGCAILSACVTLSTRNPWHAKVHSASSCPLWYTQGAQWEAWLCAPRLPCTCLGTHRGSSAPCRLFLDCAIYIFIIYKYWYKNTFTIKYLEEYKCFLHHKFYFKLVFISYYIINS